MRYTKVSATSYAVALVLLGVAAVFATWRRQGEVRGVDRGAGPLPFVGREAYAADCAGCHPDAGTVAGSLGAVGDWRPFADLLLTGQAQLIDRGETRMLKRHPTFDDASDDRLAAILDYLGSRTEGARPSSRVTPAEIGARRSSLRQSSGSK